MPNDPIRLGIIGAGRIAQTIHIPTYLKFKKAKLVAIADVDEYRVRWVADRYQINHPFTDYHDLIQMDDIDAIDICAPTFLHHQMAIDALNAGKHVFCEKPMALSLKHCQEMVETANKVNRKLMIGMNQRFRPDIQILKSLMDANQLGEIYYIKSGWLLGFNRWGISSVLTPKVVESRSSALFDLGQQLLDLMLWLLKFPEIEISIGSTLNTSKTFSELDFASIFIRTKSKTTLNLEVSWSLSSDTDFTYITLNGSKGLAALNPMRSSKDMIILQEKDGGLKNITPSDKKSANVYQKSYHTELNHFIDSIVYDRTPVSSGEEILSSMEIIHQIFLQNE